MREFSLYQANCCQNEKNPYYPNKVEVRTLEQLFRVSEKDHTAGRFQNNHRSVDDFISSNCIMGDLDNGETDNEDFFKTVDDIAEAFPDVGFYYVFSRNHMKPKKRQDGTYLEPRYKVHIYFPVSREYTDAAKYNKMQYAIGFLFPYFDAGASDAARFFYGVQDPDRTDRGGVIEGALCIDEYLRRTFKHNEDYYRACENALDNAIEEASRDSPDWRSDKLAWKDLKEWCKKFAEATRTRNKAAIEDKANGIPSGSENGGAENNVAVQELIHEVKNFLKRHDLPDEPEQQGEYYRFPVPCPYCDKHTTEDTNGPRSRLIVSPTRYGGATINYKCFHSSCQAYHHNDRRIYFQHYGERFEHGNITPIVKPKDEQKTPARKSIKADSAAELVAADIKPLEFMIPDLLPVGLSMLAAPPKFFKSYMALDMCIAVASGGKFLGRQCEKHDCLYLDLESTKRRPKARLEQILWGREPPGNLFIITGADDVGQVGNGFEDVILDQIRQHPSIRLIVVDVFQKIRPAGKRTQNAYEQDYEVMGHLKKLADELNIALLLIHHTRKARTADAFDAISGSTGLMGSTDCTIMIEKEDRYADEGVLCITGRDLDAQKLRIRWNKFSFRWEYVGTDEEIREEEEVSAYENSAVVQTVKKLVERFDGHWEGSASEVIEASKYFQSRIFSDAQKVGKAIKQFRIRLELDGISVREEKRGHGSRKVYVFEKKPTALTEGSAPTAPTAPTETA